MPTTCIRRDAVGKKGLIKAMVLRAEAAAPDRQAEVCTATVASGSGVAGGRPKAVSGAEAGDAAIKRRRIDPEVAGAGEDGIVEKLRQLNGKALTAMVKAAVDRNEEEYDRVNDEYVYGLAAILTVFRDRSVAERTQELERALDEQREVNRKQVEEIERLTAALGRREMDSAPATSGGV